MSRFLLLIAISVFLRVDAATNPSERIDELVEANLVKHQVRPHAAIDDDTFLRRAYLNIGGRIPTIDEATAFGHSPAGRRRAQLIDQLLNGEAFVSHFYNYWADILRMQDHSKAQRGNVFIQFQLWVKEAIRTNMPYDQFVREIVSAHGMSWEKKTIGYYVRDRGMPLDNMANTVRIFLGTRLECAQCHDHPFDSWSQKDFFKMAAYTYPVASFFNGAPLQEKRNRYLAELEQRAAAVYRKAIGHGDSFPVVHLEEQDPQKLERYIRSRSGWSKDPWIGPVKGIMSTNEFRALVKKGWAAAKGVLDLNAGARLVSGDLYRPLALIGLQSNDRTLKLPHDYQYDDAQPLDEVSPGTLFGRPVDPNRDRHEQLEDYAQWMSSSDTPRFTRVIANRLWKFALGAGIFEPVDSLTDHTAISNPELLAYLEKLTIDSGYDLKHVLTAIFNTRAWQRTAKTEESFGGQPFHFSGPKLRRMTAEQIWDSLVTLNIPNPDEYHPQQRSQLVRLERERLVWSSLEGRPYDELVSLFDEFAPMAAGLAAERRRVAFAMTDARTEGKIDRLRELKRQIIDQNNRFAEALSERGWSEVHQAEQSGHFQSIKGTSPGIYFSINRPKPLPIPETVSVQQRKKWVADQQAETRRFQRSAARMARASELRMPAPRGHFLREFGQSDRELIQNASDRPSATQALALMNGPTIDSLTSPYSVFGSQVAAATDPKAKVQIIFQGMLGRQPTERELRLGLAKLNASAKKGATDLVWALLNTQQFLFVQ